MRWHVDLEESLTRAPEIAEVALATAVEFGKRQGKTVIVVNDGPGFYTSRVLGPYGVEAFHLLTEGASVEAIDAAIADAEAANSKLPLVKRFSASSFWKKMI